MTIVEPAMPGAGHNSETPQGRPDHDQLRSLIERIERLEEEKKALGDDIKDVYSEAKADGFDTKIMRKIVALRRKDHAERKEEEALMELYLDALGMA